MTKGQLMKLVYTKDELRNIDSGVPREIYMQPGFNSWCHVMNYNEPNRMGKLENMEEIAKERGIKLPYQTEAEMEEQYANDDYPFYDPSEQSKDEYDGKI